MPIAMRHTVRSGMRVAVSRTVGFPKVQVDA